MRDATLEELDDIQWRTLWLAVRMVDSANNDRDQSDGVKVGGHQASSASLVTAMTALWFSHLNPEDRVSVKPHAPPMLHAINYKLGGLDRSYLTRLRSFGGLRAYPSRTKEPDRVDFSTGSVGLGAAAPLFAATARRYVDAHFTPRPAIRFIAFLGDAELDEGNIWEAVADPAPQGLGNVLWVVDFNRQSLDRVVPGIRIKQWTANFEAAGWHVVEAKYGPLLRDAFLKPGGDVLESWIDSMSNERYQSLFQYAATELRDRFLEGAPSELLQFCDSFDDDALRRLITDLGGHDLSSMLDAYRQCEAVVDRPSAIFAYTVKGWGLPIAGNPRNHSALLTSDQIDELRTSVGLTADTEWYKLDPGTAAGEWLGTRAQQLARPVVTACEPITVPESTGVSATKAVSTQEAFGRIVVGLSRDPGVRPYLVTMALDVATSTNVAGYINREGAFHPVEQVRWSSGDAVKWNEGPTGHHIELGISEMSLFLLLGQLGLTYDHSAQRLIPIGTLYDPFVLSGLDAVVYSVYSGARFIVAGTPSGVTLAPERGAHQSTITASVGLDLSNVTMIEPAFATALDWLVCSAAGDIAFDKVGGDANHTKGSYYFRLSTRPIDREPFDSPRVRLGDARLRPQVLAGAYRLIDAGARASGPVVRIVACGAVMREAIEAAGTLAGEGVRTHVVDVTSADRLFTAWRSTLIQSIRAASPPSVPGVVRAAFDFDAPVVTVHDAAAHALAWLGSAIGTHTVSLGVDTFGQSGTVDDLYAVHDLTPESIVNGALAALTLHR